jgi:hypothetical protein
MMHAFGYGLFYASVGVLLLPQEALHMFEEEHAIFLAVMLALAGVSQLVSPAAGYVSDRTCSRCLCLCVCVSVSVCVCVYLCVSV